MSLAQSTLPAQEHIVLLHGLARSPQSMEKMQAALESAGYTVHNLGYDSRHHTIEVLAVGLAQKIQQATGSVARVHIVTHSMGGILVRQIQATEPIPNLGRVVMLSPPNKGSEVVDKIGHWWLFQKVNGPAGQQLGTDAESLPNQLGKVNFECGILTGDRSINWINSSMIAGEDDGKVSVESARIEGMGAFKVVHAPHPFIMKKKIVIEDVVRFLEYGRFTTDS